MSKHHAFHIAWAGLSSVLWAARNGYHANGKAAARWVVSRVDASAFDRHEASGIARRVELGACERIAIVPAAQLVPRIKDSGGRLAFEAIKGGTPGWHGEYCVMRWPRLFGQFFRFDKWILCRG